MADAKIINLRARPSQWSNLCFEAGGIVELTSAELGQTVVRFDFPAWYRKLSNTVPGNPARLQFDANGIRIDPDVAASMLCSLRSEPIKAMLDKAIGARQNEYYGKYAHQVAVIAKMRALYDASVADSKPQRLARLSVISQAQADLLKGAYTADGRLGVVKSTTAAMLSRTDSRGASCSTSVGDGINQATNHGTQSGWSSNSSNSDSKIETESAPYVDTESGTEVSSRGTKSEADNRTVGLASGDSWGSNFGTSFVNLRSSSISRMDNRDEAIQAQSSLNTDYGYRVPNLESQAQNERAQISLMDEQFDQFMSGLNLSKLEDVFRNELQAIDLDVKRLQVSYLHTMLMSPIDGVITGIYKYPGDYVSPGEAVARVENNQTIYLVGTLLFRDIINVGDQLTVTTNPFSRPGGAQANITGEVVAARGRREDDRWEVVAKCANVSNGRIMIPLEYHFDYDNTSATIP